MSKDGETIQMEPGSTVWAKVACVVNVLIAIFIMLMVRLDSTWGHNPDAPGHFWQMALAIGLLTVAVWGWITRMGGRVSIAVAGLMLGLAMLTQVAPALFENIL